MADSKPRKKTVRRWDKENLLTVGVRLRLEEAQAFKRYAAQEGRAVNSILKEFVYECIGKEFPSHVSNSVLPKTDPHAQASSSPSNKV